MPGISAMARQVRKQIRCIPMQPAQHNIVLSCGKWFHLSGGFFWGLPDFSTSGNTIKSISPTRLIAAIKVSCISAHSGKEDYNSLTCRHTYSILYSFHSNNSRIIQYHYPAGSRLAGMETGPFFSVSSRNCHYDEKTHKGSQNTRHRSPCFRIISRNTDQQVKRPEN